MVMIYSTLVNTHTHTDRQLLTSYTISWASWAKNENIEKWPWMTVCGVIADVVFEVDDGTVRAHRALLTSRSDVMASMFTNDFLEKSAKLVLMPDIFWIFHVQELLHLVLVLLQFLDLCSGTLHHQHWNHHPCNMNNSGTTEDDPYGATVVALLQDLARR